MTDLFTIYMCKYIAHDIIKLRYALKFTKGELDHHFIDIQIFLTTIFKK